MKDDIAYSKTLVRLSPESSVSIGGFEGPSFGGRGLTGGGGWDGFGG